MLLAKRDHRAAATVIIQTCGPELTRYLRGLLGNRIDAEEAFADACRRIWNAVDAFRGDCALRTWAHRLAWSAAMDLRKEAWRTRLRHLETGEAEALCDSGGTRSWLRHERLRMSLDDLRAALTFEDRNLLQLRVDQGLSWAECASIMSRKGVRVRPDALMKRFERIKRRLATLARRRGQA